ncbi:MAG: response regulator [Bacteroidales bacterium]|nr:response regulator [Bacteroidales bacterium]
MSTLKSPQGKYILIAEDDDSSFFYFKEVLQKTKCKIIRALNGKEAVEMVKNNDDIALVLMDIQMPLMDGNEASNHIRKIRKELPIIAQTAYVVPDNISKYININCDELLVKPIAYNKLLAVVNQYLSV